MMAICCDDKTVKLFNLYGFRFKQSLSKHSNWLSSCQFSKEDNNKLISGGYDKNIFIWDLEKNTTTFE